MPERADPRRRRGLRGLMAAGIVAWCVFGYIVVADNQVPDGAAGTVVVVFRPDVAGETALRAIVEAGGLLLDGGPDGLIWVARSDRSGFAARLRARGAWGIFRPEGPVGCLFALGA